MRRFASLRSRSRGWTEEELVLTPAVAPPPNSFSDLPPPRSPSRLASGQKRRPHAATLGRLDRPQTLTFPAPTQHPTSRHGSQQQPGESDEGSGEHSPRSRLPEADRKHRGALATSSLPSRRKMDKGLFHSLSVRSSGGGGDGGSDSSMSSTSSVSSTSMSTSTLWEDFSPAADAVTHGAVVIAGLVRLKTVPFQEWNVRDVCMWLDLLCMGMYIQAFRRNEVTGQYLTQIDKHDLRSMGMKSIGHRKRFERRFKMLVDGDEGALDEPSLTERRGAKNSSTLWTMNYHPQSHATLKIPSFSISSFSIGGASKKERDERKQRSNNNSTSSKGSVDDTALIGGGAEVLQHSSSNAKHGTIDGLIETLTSTANHDVSSMSMPKRKVAISSSDSHTPLGRQGKRRGSVCLMIEHWEQMGSDSGTVQTNLTRTTSGDRSSAAPATPEPMTSPKSKSPRSFKQYFGRSRAKPEGDRGSARDEASKPHDRVDDGSMLAMPTALLLSPAIRALKKDSQRRLSIPVTPREKRGTEIRLRLAEERQAEEERKQQAEQRLQRRPSPPDKERRKKESESEEQGYRGGSHESAAVEPSSPLVRKRSEEGEEKGLDVGVTRNDAPKKERKAKRSHHHHHHHHHKEEKGAKSKKNENEEEVGEGKENGKEGTQKPRKPRSKSHKRSTRPLTSSATTVMESPAVETETTPLPTKSEATTTTTTITTADDEHLDKKERTRASKAKGRSKSLSKGGGKEIEKELQNGNGKESTRSKKSKRRTVGLMDDWQKLKMADVGSVSPVVRRVKRRETLGSLLDEQPGGNEKEKEKKKKKKKKEKEDHVTIHASLDQVGLLAVAQSPKKEKRKEMRKEKEDLTTSPESEREKTTKRKKKKEKKEKKEKKKERTSDLKDRNGTTTEAERERKKMKKKKKKHAKKDKEEEMGKGKEAKSGMSGQRTRDKQEAVRAREKAMDEMMAWWWYRRTDGRVMIKCVYGEDMTLLFVRADIRLPQIKRLIRQKYQRPPDWRFVCKSHANLQRRLVTLNKTPYLQAALQYHIRTCRDRNHPLGGAAMKLYVCEV